MRTLLLMLLIIMSALLMSCTNQPRKVPESVIDKYGNIAIVPARYLPETQFVTFARSPVSGGIKGGLEGAGTGFLIGFSNMPYPDPLTGLLTGILLLPVTVPLGVVGGLNIYTTEDIATRTEKLLSDAVLAQKMSFKVSEIITKRAIYLPQVNQQLELDYGPEKLGQPVSYSNLAHKNINTVLEIGIIRAGFRLGHKRNTIRLYLDAQTRLVNVRDNRLISANEFSFESDDKIIAAWSSNKGKPLHDAFTYGYHELADRIYDNLLEQQPYWPFKTNVMYFNRDDNEAYCWLKPVRPQCEYINAETKKFFGLKVVLKDAETKFTKINVSKTGLKWQAFPRQQDIVDLNTDILNKITDISYDLRIWNWDGTYCDSLVYERIQLPEPQHLVETKLKRGGKYCWSFRARYLLSGQRQFTGWSYSALPLQTGGISPPLTCYLDEIPDNRYYRFQVPFH